MRAPARRRRPVGRGDRASADAASSRVSSPASWAPLSARSADDRSRCAREGIRQRPSRRVHRRRRRHRRRRCSSLAVAAMTSFDAIIIGAGQAGPPLADRLERGRHDGRVRRAQAVRRHVRQYRVHADQDARGAARTRHTSPGGPPTTASCSTSRPRIDMQAVKARADAVVGQRPRLASSAACARSTGCTVFTGHARFESPTTVRVGDDVLTAPRIFINVGGRARVPDFPGIDDVPFLTNTDILAARHGAAASRRRRRQLHRPRVRADVSSLRRRGHHRRDGSRV